MGAQLVKTRQASGPGKPLYVGQGVLSASPPAPTSLEPLIALMWGPLIGACEPPPCQAALCLSVPHTFWNLSLPAFTYAVPTSVMPFSTFCTRGTPAWWEQLRLDSLLELCGTPSSPQRPHWPSWLSQPRSPWQEAQVDQVCWNTARACRSVERGGPRCLLV